MPPAGAPTPGRAQLKAFASELERDLDAAAQETPYAGQAVVRRLNRTEYANAIHDLLAIELPMAAELPQDGIAAGFDNIADALVDVAPAARALPEGCSPGERTRNGNARAAPVTEVYPVNGTQAAWQEGMPFGTRGGIRSTALLFARRRVRAARLSEQGKPDTYRRRPILSNTRPE